MVFQIEMLRDVVLWVEQQQHVPLNLREWWQSGWTSSEIYLPDQDSYVQVEASVNGCGSAFCVAGKIVFDAGLTTVGGWLMPQGDLVERLGRCPSGDGWKFPNVARRLLGVPDDDYVGRRLLMDMFDGSNTAKGVRNCAAELAAHYGEVL